MARLTIFSNTTFNVYKELSFVDKSLDIEKAKVVATAQLIRVLPTFTTNKVQVKKGDHSYDAKILDWPTIRQFIKQGVLRITSADHITYYRDQEEAAKAAKAKKDAKKAKSKTDKAEPAEAKIEPTDKKVVKKETPKREPKKVKSLDDMADDE